jgi:hypothetical protein
MEPSPRPRPHQEPIYKPQHLEDCRGHVELLQLNWNGNLLPGAPPLRPCDRWRYVRRVVDRDHLVDGRDLFLAGLDPARQFLGSAKQIGALPLQFLSTLTLLHPGNGAGDYPTGRIKSDGFCYRMPVRWATALSGCHPAYPETQQILCALERLIKGEDLNGRVPRQARASLVHASVLDDRVPLDQWNGIPSRAATRNQIANALVERRTQAQDVEAMRLRQLA